MQSADAMLNEAGLNYKDSYALVLFLNHPEYKYCLRVSHNWHEWHI